MFRTLNKIFGYYIGYYLTLAAFTHFADIKSEKKEYHFSPLVQREEIVWPISEIMNLYFDCDQKFYNSGKFRLTRTTDELEETATRRKNLEEKLTRYYNEQVALSQLTSHPIDTTPGWHDPLNGRGWFHNSFNDPRPRPGRRTEKHNAIDIFAPLNSYIYSPGNGVILASSNDWTGKWSRRKGMHDPKGGLGELTGNGVLIFSPSDKRYYLTAHLKDVYVRAGDIVSGGTIIGTVGKTGNAIPPNLGSHNHFGIKEEGEGCGVQGILKPINPFWKLAENRGMLNRPLYVEESLY